MASSRGPSLDDQLAEDLAQFYADPLGYVMFAFPWTTDASIQIVELQEPYKSRFNSKYGPDVWACQFLDQLGEEIRKRGFDGRNAVDPIRFATASGHGIGKSTLVAWLIKFILDTRPYSRGRVTAGTDTQLRTTTWAELGKWHRLSPTAHWFEYSAGRGSMMLKHREFGEGWSCEAITSREENSQNFAGKHAVNSTNFYVFDEASTIPNSVFEVRDGGLTDGEPMVFDFGNPTRNTGRFFEECEGNLKHRYSVRHIDSRSVAITNKKMLAELIEDHGIDSDVAKVRILGQFPSMGSLQFIESLDVKVGQMRATPDINRNRDPFVLGVDVARFGDDEMVVYPRKGPDARSFDVERWTGQDTVASVARIISIVQKYEALGLPTAMIFVDETGLGAGIVDQLRNFGYPVHGVTFNTKPVVEPKTYRFRGDEIWGLMKASLKRNLVLPADDSRNGKDLYEQLTQRQFGYTILGNKVQLESKPDMKKRGVASPDIADALALTFAMEVSSAVTTKAEPQTTTHDYDPLAQRVD